ncbi:hypothetical protein FRC05_004031 [Tulasnella sp. 425]|nr:hypothetical protein FRC05_004031 [Tulasnella sp. 425]
MAAVRWGKDPTAETDFPIDLWGVALIIWFMLAGLPKPWGQAGAPIKANQPNQLRWGWLEELHLTSECVDFLDGFLVDRPSKCRTIESAESQSWIQNGITVDPNAEGEKDGYGAVVDEDVSPSDDTQVGFDDVY